MRIRNPPPIVLIILYMDLMAPAMPKWRRLAGVLMAINDQVGSGSVEVGRQGDVPEMHEKHINAQQAAQDCKQNQMLWPSCLMGAQPVTGSFQVLLRRAINGRCSS